MVGRAWSPTTPCSRSPPCCYLTVAAAGLIFERPAVEGRIVTELRALVGDDGADAEREQPGTWGALGGAQHRPPGSGRDHRVRPAPGLAQPHLADRRGSTRGHGVGLDQ